MNALPAHVQADVQRILDAAARRLLEEQQQQMSPAPPDLDDPMEKEAAA